MIDLKQIKLKDLTPTSIATDKNIDALSMAIDEEVNKLAEDIKQVLFLARIEELSDEVLNELAWQYHVDFYQDTFPREAKINLIRTSIATHRIKGTPAAVEKVCKDVFKSAQVVENWEYGGRAYSFKVRLIKEDMPENGDIIPNLIGAIKNYKNTRSWLDEISFYRTINGTVYYGSVVGQYKEVTIYPAKVHVPNIEQSIYYGGAIGQYKKVTIHPAKVHEPNIMQNIYQGVAIGQYKKVTIKTKF